MSMKDKSRGGRNRSGRRSGKIMLPAAAFFLAGMFSALTLTAMASFFPVSGQSKLQSTETALCAGTSAPDTGISEAESGTSAPDTGTTVSKRTLKELLQTALEPAGSTMYVWGGGWNKADTGAGTEARTIGVSPRWERFFLEQDSSYDYHTTRYQIHDGLDCSGYIGWCIYNVMNTKNGESGYVMKAQEMASDFASRGWGKYISRSRVIDYKAGDIMSSACQDCGHVWMAVGSCGDGSVVILHSSPPGVQLNGTPAGDGTADSQAVKLARYYMEKYYPDWYKKYPDCERGFSYLEDYAQFRWDVSGNSVMSDPDGYRSKDADAILKDLLGE